MQVCRFWLTCPCECHVQITKMFQLVGEPRQLMDNPEYIVKRDFKMPSPEEVLRDKASVSNEKLQIIKSDNPDVPDTVIRTPARDNGSDRQPKGSLETNVKLACDAWIKQGGLESGVDCTTKWVAEWIDEELGIQNVSRGAIDACWRRWMDRLGFAMILNKPTRFLCYTPAGIEHGLQGLKDKHDREVRHKITNMKLGRKE